MLETIKARTRALLRPLALPAWLLLGLSWLRAAFSSWSELEFFLEKIGQYRAVQWLISPYGLMVLGFAWLTLLLLRPPERGAGAAPATDTDRRLAAIRGLLREASAALRSIPDTPIKTAEEATKRAWPYMIAADFLARGFAHRVKPDFDAYIPAEREKVKAAGKAFNLTNATADYFDALAERLTPDDLDLGFHLPDDWQQFVKGSDKWPPNKR